MKSIKSGLIIVVIMGLFNNIFAKEKPELLFYVGITMVKPVAYLAKEFEKRNDCKIKILQGGSQDLYDSIKMSKTGDLYLPGSVVYRYRNLLDSILLDGKFVGFNKLALVVKKGNPKGIKADLSELSNPNLRVVLGNEHSGSIGNATKKILKKSNSYRSAMLNTIFLSPDSRNLTKALKEDKADLILNWYATTFWKQNSDEVEALELDDEFSNKSKLVLNLLATSKNKDLTKKFMDFAASKEGRKVFYNYGFLNDEDLKNFDKVTF